MKNKGVSRMVTWKEDQVFSFPSFPLTATLTTLSGVANFFLDSSSGVTESQAIAAVSDCTALLELCNFMLSKIQKESSSNGKSKN